MSKEKALLLRNTPERLAIRKTVKPKERLAIKRVKMSEASPEMRLMNQRMEVEQGLTLEEAQQEATRCMDCVNPTCMDGCPVNVNIPGFIKEIERGEIISAASILRETSSLPAVCGRVCPQEKQCEAKCFYIEKLNKPAVAIGKLERFAADFEREYGKPGKFNRIESNGIKVAVIGSGPAGLSFAMDMQKAGYEVTVFEALHEIGGVLKYGIPEFRLPNTVVDFEIENLKKIGVQFVRNFIVGQTASVEDLKKEGYTAFFVASGAGLPRFMNIPGENLNGIYSSNEYLTRVNLMEADLDESDTPVAKGKTVVVIGGGNTAMDSVRTAKRLGAERAIVLYRRSEEEMPARREEVHHAKQEGVEFLTLCNPIEYLPGKNGRVHQIRVQKMKLDTADDSGRRKAVPVVGEEFLLDAEVVVVAIGVSPNPIIQRSLKSLETTQWGTIKTIGSSQESSISGIYAGGDIVRGGATVILAMGDGRKAAAEMQKYFRR